MSAGTTQTGVDARARELYRRQLESVWVRRDRLLAWLLGLQWLLALGLAVVLSPHAWDGKVHSTHLHVHYAALYGGFLTVPPILLTVFRPGRTLTRHAVAVAQMLWSALLIHLSGGRIETHFHVFGSLAFLAYYRDWKVLATATGVVAADHLWRGLTWPESVYGIANPEWWRFLEHAWWVLFEDAVLVMSIVESRREMRALAGRQAAMEELNATIERRVEERSEALRQETEERRRAEAQRSEARALAEEILRHAGDPILAIDGAGTVLIASDSVEAVFQWSPDELVGRNVSVLMDEPYRSEHDGYLRAYFASGQARSLGQTRKVRGRRRDGSTFPVELLASRVTSSSQPLFVGIMRDLSVRLKLEEELRQAQKLESVGRLAAGVAHEINTPVQFVSDSVHFVRDAFGQVQGLLRGYGELRSAASGGRDTAHLADELARAEEEADLAYLLEHAPKALERSIDGLDRVATIVRSMKEFAHPDHREMAPVDLNQAIRSTLTIARNEFKYVAELELDLGELPSVTCLAGEVNQVVLNLVVNAAHAIGDVVRGTEAKGRITVRTRRDGDCAVVSVADTGGGIPEAIRGRIFDPFFTTKEVGKGTGQGLAIARSVVVEQHGGELTFTSEVGKGTTFSMRLPLAGRPAQAGKAAA